MITNEETRKAIEKYQKEHPLKFGVMIDVTSISSKAGTEIISQTIEKISKKVEEDTDLWCICEMAKMYMQGVRPVYPVRKQGEWIKEDDEHLKGWYRCSECGRRVEDLTDDVIIHAGCEDYTIADIYPYCHCGAKMKGGAE